MRSMTDAHEVLNAIREPGAFGGNPPLWAEAMAAMPAGKPEFLDPAALSARRAAGGLAAALIPFLRPPSRWRINGGAIAAMHGRT